MTDKEHELADISPEDTTVVEDPTWIKELPEDERDVKTDDVSIHTQLVCPKCRGKNYLRDGKCVKCDKGWV